jgi:hypothetical protein
MILRLVRTTFTDVSTIGELYIDRERFCYTLEDPVREKKIPKVTAIPYGTYTIIMTYSPKFEMMMPLLCGVPNYEGVRIHAGNNAQDTDGCILVGFTKGKDVIGESRKAFNTLLTMFKEANNAIKIEIVKA